MSDEAECLKLLTVDDTAEILKVRKHRVYELVRLKLLPTVRLGRQLRIDEQKLREWIANGGSSLDGGWKKTA